MNRGNLAEDPRAGRPSSSRYSRSDERNALLYASDREWKKAIAKREAEGKAAGRKRHAEAHGYTEGAAADGNGRHGFPQGGRERETDNNEQSVGAPAEGFSKLEVGMHGRLFGVQENHTAGAAPEKHAVQHGAAPERHAAQHPENIRIREAQQLFTVTAKPDRPYLNAQNPLLEKRIISRGRSLETSGKAAERFMEAGAPARTPADTGKRSVRKFLISAGAGVLAAGYVATGIHFSDHFYPGTEFFGIEASGDTVAEAKELVRKKVDGYRLELKGRSSSGMTQGMRDEIPAGGIGLRYHDDGTIDRAMRHQYPALWPVMMIRALAVKNQKTLATEYDSARVDQALKGLSVFDSSRVTEPKNAELKFDESGAYVSKEVMGTTLDYARTREAVVRALNAGRTSIDLDRENLYVNPVTYSDDDRINEKADALNRVLGANLTLDFGDRSVSLNPEAVAENLLSLDRDGNYYLDEDKIAAYAERLADRFDTVGRKRTFSTSLGTEVELDGGDYGWTLDTESTAAEITDALKAKRKVTLEPVYDTTAMSRGENDIGDTYVEIDLTNQHLWFYMDGSLMVDAPVVTGNPQKNNETPSGGVWSLKGKYRNATLKGEGYATPVDYWMPFNGGVGIHDLQSRYYFGGSVYNGAGSHGCINTPLAAVKRIYHYIESGTPVVVYKDESDTAVSQNTGMQDIRTITSYIDSVYGTVPDDDAPAGEGGGQTFETDQAGVRQ